MKKLNKLLLSPWLAIITLILMLSIRIADPSFVESVRLRYFDQLITSKGATVSQQVHVVNIDDETIRQKGQFPFPRGEYSKLITDLYSRGAGLVVFNIYMPERDRFGQDNQLASTLQQFPVVLPHTAGSAFYTTDKHLPFRPGVSVIGDGEPGIKYGTIEPNIKLLNETAAGIGVVNTLPEIDGVTRRIPMVVSSKGQLYPSISLETLRVAAGDPSFQVKVSDSSIEAVRIPKFGKITTDGLGRVWVDWSSKPIEHSASKLPKDFNGGIVIVGLTAKGLNNPVATAVGSVYPHYLQAAVLDTLISGTNINRPDWADGAEILALILISLSLLFLTRYVYVGLAWVVITSIAAVAGSYFAYSNLLWLFDITTIVSTILLVSLHAYGVKFVSEFLQKQQIKKQFGGYVSPIIVNQLAEDPEAAAERLKGEKRDLSIVMTDLRGFTTLGESFGEDVQGLTNVMNRYMDALSRPVLKNGGCIIKYIGDASLHVHNAPVDDKEHAVTAVTTALEMIKAIEEFNKELQAEGRPPVGMGAGVNTGPTLIGNIGANERYGYDVLGDSVSTAARLEGQTKSYGVLLIIGPETAELVKHKYSVVELDCIAVKGKTIGLKIFTIAPSNELHEHWLELYYAGEWKKALTLVPQLKNVTPELEHYYDNMSERLKHGVPNDWDGTYRATSK